MQAVFVGLQDEAVTQHCLEHCLPWAQAKELQPDGLAPKTRPQLAACGFCLFVSCGPHTGYL